MMANSNPENTLRFAWWAGEEQGLRRLGRLRRRAVAGRARPHRAVHELRHGRLAELHLHGLRRRRVDVRGTGRPSRRVRSPSRTSTSRTTRARRALRRHRVLRPERLRGLHPRRHPVERPVHRAEEIKTEEQEAIWGGTAGEQFDPCYHLACDTFENVDLHALEVNSDLIAFAMLTFAYSTESVNGVPGKEVPGRPFDAAGAGRSRGHVRSRRTTAERTLPDERSSLSRRWEPAGFPRGAMYADGGGDGSWPRCGPEDRGIADHAV